MKNIEGVDWKHGQINVFSQEAQNGGQSVRKQDVLSP